MLQLATLLGQNDCNQLPRLTVAVTLKPDHVLQSEEKEKHMFVQGFLFHPDIIIVYFERSFTTL